MEASSTTAYRCFMFMYFLLPPLGTGHMAQPGTDQYEGKFAVREAANHADPAVDLPGRYRSIIAVSKEIPLSMGTLRATSPEVVVRLRL